MCDLLKSWFRVLPGGMFPDASRMKLIEAASKCTTSFIASDRSQSPIGQTDVDLDKKLSNLRNIVHELPRIHFDLLKRLMEHLDK